MSGMKRKAINRSIIFILARAYPIFSHASVTPGLVDVPHHYAVDSKVG